MSFLRKENYSDKALVLRHDPEDYVKYADKVRKEFGGIYNRRLIGGPGWLINKKHERKVDEFIDECNGDIPRPRSLLRPREMHDREMHDREMRPDISRRNVEMRNDILKRIQERRRKEEQDEKLRVQQLKENKKLKKKVKELDLRLAAFEVKGKDKGKDKKKGRVQPRRKRQIIEESESSESEASESEVSESEVSESEASESEASESEASESEESVSSLESASESESD